MVTATYRLTARSRCRTDTADASVTLFRPGTITIVGLELVQAIQTFDVSDPERQNTVRLAADKTTVARVYLNFDGADFDYGGGPGKAPSVRGEVRLLRPGSGRSFLVSLETRSVPPGRLMDRSQRHGSLVATIRPDAVAPDRLEGIWPVTVTVDATTSDGRRRIASATTSPQTFTFFARREVAFVAFRVRDIANDHSPPSLVEVLVSMKTNIDRLPLADSDALPVRFPPVLITEHDFTLLDDDGEPDREPWEDMLDDLEDAADKAPVTPTAGERGAPLVTYVAFLPDATYNGIGGIANDDPYLVAITLPLGEIVAHEFGHTLGLDHAPGGETPEDEADPRLVAVTEDHGFDTGGDSNTVVPQGSNDFMQDFGGRGVSLRTWNYIFDRIGSP